MLKQILLIGAAAVSFPALAQEAPPASDPTAPAPASEPAPAPDAATQSAPASGQPAPSGAAATPAQVAQIVDQEFASYDADSTGDLNEAEFGAWMKKLRAATDPSVDPESAEVKTWIGQAFAAADGDKSKSVSKTELTGFLSRGA
ncbi:calcium-binding protein [Sphingopyxis sp. R3-92]|uniref:calcium-binding protein n=1 Tax=Sphingopyxis sp. R3-92 TaxID=3158553 RepID=UPI003EE71485